MSVLLMSLVSHNTLADVDNTNMYVRYMLLAMQCSAKPSQRNLLKVSILYTISYLMQLQNLHTGDWELVSQEKKTHI